MSGAGRTEQRSVVFQQFGRNEIFLLSQLSKIGVKGLTVRPSAIANESILVRCEETNPEGADQTASTIFKICKFQMMLKRA
jgi:hypothetical protein